VNPTAKWERKKYVYQKPSRKKLCFVGPNFGAGPVREKGKGGEWQLVPKKEVGLLGGGDGKGHLGKCTITSWVPKKNLKRKKNTTAKGVLVGLKEPGVARFLFLVFPPETKGRGDFKEKKRKPHCGGGDTCGGGNQPTGRGTSP